MPKTTVDVDKTRSEIRHQFSMWDIDPSEFEIVWQEDRTGGRINRLPGATVRYMRNGQWQSISCFGFPSRAANLRQCFLLLERLRIAEQNGVQYEGLTFTKDLVPSSGELGKKENLLDAYDILGVSPDDPLDLLQRVYLSKTKTYHPDVPGGNAEKFKRLQEAYELVMKSRGQKV